MPHDDDGAPNLDGMAVSELEAFANEYRNTRDRDRAARLFPDRPRGMIRAARDLGRYAVHKSAAMQARAGGRIGLALELEAQCEILYQRLPGFAKW